MKISENQIKLQLPSLVEVYERKIKKEINGKTLIITICHLRLSENSQDLAFGIARMGDSKKYISSVGRKLAYGMAMRFLFLKYTGPPTIIEMEDGKETEL